MKNNDNGGGTPASGGRTPISRRDFVEAAAVAGVGLATLGVPAQSQAEASDKQTERTAMSGDNAILASLNAVLAELT